MHGLIKLEYLYCCVTCLSMKKKETLWYDACNSKLGIRCISVKDG
jgi:hypothetical protein